VRLRSRVPAAQCRQGVATFEYQRDTAIQNGWPCLYRLKKYPAYVVYCKVLNLLKQVGYLPGMSALAEAYRIDVARSAPFLWVLAQNGSAASRTQQGKVLIPQSQEHE